MIETRQDSRTGRRPISLKGTILLHIVVLGSLWFYGWMRVPPISEPPLEVTFAQIAPPPPPPPPPPPAAKAPTPKVEPVMPKPEELVQPEKIPETAPPQTPDTAGTSGTSNSDAGVAGGVEGGVAGGVPGGVVGSVGEPSGPLRVGGDVLAPQVETRVDPIYPPAARNAGLTGEVVLEIIVRRDGTVDPSGIKVIRGMGMGMTQSAQDAVKKWRFKPATRHGIPVDVIDRIEVSFIIR